MAKRKGPSKPSLPIRGGPDIFSAQGPLHDRFHGMPYLNKVIDQIRRRELKKQTVLQNARLAILKNDDNRTERQKEIFQGVSESRGVFRRVWKLKEDLKFLFESSTWKKVSPYLQCWIASSRPVSKKSVRWPRVSKPCSRRWSCLVLSIVPCQSRAMA